MSPPAPPVIPVSAPRSSRRVTRWQGVHPLQRLVDQHFPDQTVWVGGHQAWRRVVDQVVDLVANAFFRQAFDCLKDDLVALVEKVLLLDEHRELVDVNLRQGHEKEKKRGWGWVG